MYILKALEVFAELEYAEDAKTEPGYYDYKEVIAVPLPEGKTYEDVAEWKFLYAHGEIEYRLKGETDYHYFKP